MLCLGNEMTASCHHLSDDPRTCLYFTPSPPLSWARAAQACVAMGGYLAVLDDPETYDAFSQQLATYPQDSRRFWIGLRKQYASSSDWYWNAEQHTSEPALHTYGAIYLLVNIPNKSEYIFAIAAAYMSIAAINLIWCGYFV